MRVPLSWLAEYGADTTDLAALTATLDDLGLVVEGVDEVGLGLEAQVVVRVEAIDRIGGADRIRLVTVTDGTAETKVVCGAWNFEVGDLVPLARAGTVLPDGTEIRRRTVRGVVSDGMLCSSNELGLGEDHAGLLVLDGTTGATPGASLATALGLEPDTVLEIAVEGNRPDAWCIEGVARDLAAREGREFVPRAPHPPAPGERRAADVVTVAIDDPDLCGRFTATVLEGVTVAPSPTWLRQRLERCGMRPINNVVDASNYVMLELGQPTHAYDLARLGGPGFRVRRARPGERLELIDGQVVDLAEGALALGDPGDDLVICDAVDVPIGLAGVMGGAATEIDGGTTAVALEAAWFDAIAVARTAKRQRLRTEASQRFERGCDPMACDRAAARFVELLAETSPSLRVARGIVDARGSLRTQPTVELDEAAIVGRLGVEIGLDEAARLLAAIGFGVARHGSALRVTAPTSRPDVREPPFGVADVIEEVARLHGYATLPARVPSWPQPGALAPRIVVRRRVREALVGLGALEAWTATLVGESDAALLGDDAERVRVTNPVHAGEHVMRSSLLPGLLDALARNAARRQGDVALFEVGTVFTHPAAADSVRLERGGGGGGDLVKLPSEDERVCLLLGRPGDDAAAAVAAWRALAVALRLRDVRIEPDERAAAPHGLHPTRWAALRDARSQVAVGVVGEVDPDVVARAVPALERGRRLGWLDVSLDALADPTAVARLDEVARVPSRFPTADVDLALVVAETVRVHALKDVLCEAAGELCESVACFDAYRGEGVPPGARSLAMRVRLVADDRTLSEAELHQVRQRMIDAAAERLGAALR